MNALINKLWIKETIGVLIIWMLLGIIGASEQLPPDAQARLDAWRDGVGEYDNYNN